MASLILLKSPPGGTSPQSYPLDFSARSKLVIGRQREAGKDIAAADIVIDDGKQNVSRHHAVLTLVGGRYAVQNLGHNKTKVNAQFFGQNSAPQRLSDGDLIRICDFYFRFQDDPANAAEPAGEASDADGNSTVQYSVDSGAAQQFLEGASAARLRTLLEISGQLAASLEMDKLLPEILDVLFGLFAQADRAFVFELDAEGEPYPKSVQSRKSNAEQRFSRTILRNCLRDRKACLCVDTASDAALAQSDSIAQVRIHSYMCVPLTTAAGVPFGALQLDTQYRAELFGQDDLKYLAVVAKLVAMALERAQLHLTLLEVEFAKKVQVGFLPKEMPSVPGYDFYAYYNAAKLVGGDYYDFIELPDGRWAILLGDVSGKGIPASLLMAKLGAEARFCMLSEPDPAKAVTRLNSMLIRGGLGEKYITFIALVLDPAAHTITAVSAGHANPLRYRSATGEFAECLEDGPTGYPLGWVPGFEYEAKTVPLATGEFLLIYTDGVTDATSPPPDEVMFGLGGISEAMRSNAGAAMNSRTMGEWIVDSVKRHTAGRSQFDDIALVCFGRPKGD